jgi:hypothetical protein
LDAYPERRAADVERFAAALRSRGYGWLRAENMVKTLEGVAARLTGGGR